MESAVCLGNGIRTWGTVSAPLASVQRSSQMLQAERAEVSSVRLNPGLSDALALLPSLRLLPVPCPVALPGSSHFKALLPLATPVGHLPSIPLPFPLDKRLQVHC